MMTTMKLSTPTHEQLFEDLDHHWKSHPILHHISMYGNLPFVINGVHFITCHSHIIGSKNNL
jgi:hypothetical protein